MLLPIMNVSSSCSCCSSSSSLFSILITSVSAAGFLTISAHIIHFLRWTYIYFLRPSTNLTKTYGSWALITGSTDGIGKALAFELAITHGLNIILVSRNRAKLDRVSDELRQAAPSRSVKVVEVDFEKDLMAGIERIERAIDDDDGVDDLGLLINNVGVTYPAAMYFHETEDGGVSVWRKVVRVNVESTTWVTRVVLKRMMERKGGGRKRRSAVVNIGSGAGIVAPSHPLYAVYAATKAYVDQFSRSLHSEYKAQGVDVQCQIPLYVATKMVTKLMNTGREDEVIQGSSLFTPTPQAYAKAAVRRIGYERRCTPYWSHSLQWWLVASFVPDYLLDKWRLSVGLNRRARARGN